MLNADEISVDKIKSGFGGYKKKETKEYLETIRSNYDALWKENLELKDKLSVLSEVYNITKIWKNPYKRH